jgi:methylthioribose-1-phosphate isomerase
VKGYGKMNVNGKHYRTIWIKPTDPSIVQAIDQSALPYRFEVIDLASVDEVIRAIRDMQVRGAGLIGATAGYGMYISALTAPRDTTAHFLKALVHDAQELKSSRPTAINLEWAVERQIAAIRGGRSVDEMVAIAHSTAQAIADEDADFCRRIGEHGFGLIEDISRRKKGERVNILTHCNAGWLAFVDYGTATAPIYTAHDRGIAVHVWVDETRPWNQGARLTAWELGEHGVPYTVISDNAGGHLMQHGMVDIVITGTDRTTYTGDVANKIGTYLKALAARDNNVPFYVALPSSTIDWKTADGIKEIPIEERGSSEVKYISGLYNGQVVRVLLTPEESPAANYVFDVTPSRLVTGLITERGIAPASKEGLLRLFPEKGRGTP